MGLFKSISKLFGGGGGSNKEAKLARQAEEARQARIREGTANIDNIFANNFTDDFYGGRRDAYTSYARPQLDDQYGKATEGLTYELARSGLLNSSIAGDKQADLKKTYDFGLQDVVDKARSYETEARNAVNAAKSGLLNSLSVTADATGAANAANSQAAALSATPAFSPMSQLFADATSTFAQQAALEKASAASGQKYNRYDTGLFGTPSNAVKTT